MPPDQRVETGLIVDWDTIPDAGIVPAGHYHAKIDGLEAGFSKNKHVLQVKGTFIVMEPQDFANHYIYSYFSIGSEEDPQALDPELRKKSFGFQKLKEMLRALGIQMDSKLDRLLAAAEQQEIMLKMSLGKDRETGNDRNQVSKYMPLGEREPGIDDSDTGGRMRDLKSKPGKAFHDSGDEEEQTAAPASTNGKPPTKSATTKPATATTKAAAKSAAAAEETREEEEEAPAPSSKKTAAKAAAEAPAELLCPLCNKKFTGPKAGEALKLHMPNCGDESEATEGDAA